MTSPCLLFESPTKEKAWMVFDKNVAAAPAGSIDAKAVSSAARELDLYDELISFAELSPEQQRRLVAHPENKLAERAAEPPKAEPVRTHTPVKRVEAETTGPLAEAVYDSEDSNAPSETSDVRPELSLELSPSRPLPGLSFNPDLVAAAALSRNVCLTCGAESTVDDLFCITCGAFIDEIAATLPINPTCGECGVGVAADEIFCPWCGEVLAA